MFDHEIHEIHEDIGAMLDIALSSRGFRTFRVFRVFRDYPQSVDRRRSLIRFHPCDPWFPAGAVRACQGLRALRYTRESKPMRCYPWIVCSALLFCTLSRSAFAAESDLDQRIRQNRMGTLIVEGPPNSEVRVEQLRHEFWFGAALANQAFTGGMRPDAVMQYKKVFLENFNAGVTEVALKWHDMEPERGKVNYRSVDGILAWAKENAIPLRGHNIFWGIPNRVQPWLKDLDNDALRAALKARALDIARRYRGQFAEYDLNNEMLHANYYEERLGPNITRDMAAWVHWEDPNAVLFLNDYDILTGRKLPEYVAQIRKFLDQGIRFQGIGVQGHLHGDTLSPTNSKPPWTNSRSSSSRSGLPNSISRASAPNIMASATFS